MILSITYIGYLVMSYEITKDLVYYIKIGNEYVL